MMEMQLTVALLLRQFSLELVPDGSVENPAGDWLMFAKSAEPRRAAVPVPFSEAGFSTEPFQIN
jgi:hypothetical protein